jgi:hypothetical protein
MKLNFQSVGFRSLPKANARSDDESEGSDFSGDRFLSNEK